MKNFSEILNETIAEADAIIESMLDYVFLLETEIKKLTNSEKRKIEELINRLKKLK